MKNLFGLYYNPLAGFKGIVKNNDSNDVQLSSIPKDEKQEALLYFNTDGYSSYCKEYREYWEWVENRNEVRYENTLSNGKDYDAKNMMHVFRLLEMAIEIGKYQQVNVVRPNREFLPDIKSGKYTYGKLIEIANNKQMELDEAFQHSTLPDKPDINKINALAFELRNRLYTST